MFRHLRTYEAVKKEMTMPQCYISVDTLSYIGYDMNYFYEEEPLPENVFQWYFNIPEEIMDRLDEMELRLHTIQSYRWEQSFEMTITVE